MEEEQQQLPASGSKFNFWIHRATSLPDYDYIDNSDMNVETPKQIQQSLFNLPDLTNMKPFYDFSFNNNNNNTTSPLPVKTRDISRITEQSIFVSIPEVKPSIFSQQLLKSEELFKKSTIEIEEIEDSNENMINKEQEELRDLLFSQHRIKVEIKQEYKLPLLSS